MERRTLLKTAAWSTPVIVWAAAAPLAAASTPLPVCERKVWVSTVGEHDVARITVVTGEYVLAEFVKDYPNQSSLNVDGHLNRGPDGGFKAGDTLVIQLFDYAICDPTFIQVDGNNTHYYGSGIFR